MSRNFFAFIKGIVFIQLFIAAIFAGLTVDFQRLSQEGASMTDLRSYLTEVGPAIDEQKAAVLFREQSVMLDDWDEKEQSDFLNCFYALRPEKILGSNIQALATAQPVAVSEAPAPPDNIELPAVVQEENENKSDTQQANEEIFNKFKNYKVYFYCTHSAESYIPDSGQAKLEGKQGLINTVAKTLAESCKKQGLQGIFKNKIHDFPDYDKSYTLSRETVKNITDKDPKALAIFDVHRDSIPGTKSAPRIKINGKSSAQILIIVGTNERKPHPNWRQNLAFANKLAKTGEKMYPGLIRGVRTKAGTYNQEYNNHALLLEFGSDYNTLEEAKYAAELFAKVLTEVLKEEI